MKKYFALLILICAFWNLTAFAYGDNVGETIGFVADFYGDTVYIAGEPLNAHGLKDVYVCVGDAPVYDLTTGFRAFASEIEIGTDIRAAYFAEGAEPFGALIVWLNWDNDDAAGFTVVVSENINFAADGTVFLSADGKYRVAVSPNTLIIDPHTGLLSPEEITPGMEFFVWVDMITASTPALVYPDKVVLVR
jgi:hypothetical protein